MYAGRRRERPKDCREGRGNGADEVEKLWKDSNLRKRQWGKWRTKEFNPCKNIYGHI